MLISDRSIYRRGISGYKVGGCLALENVPKLVPISFYKILCH